MRFILYLLIFFSVLYPTQTKAHVLKTNNSIGAVLHIAPDDDPVAGDESNFFIEFKDKEDKFTPQTCECTVKIFKKGEEIFSQPLFQNAINPSSNEAVFSFTFPDKDIYTLKVQGTPINSSFTPFTLSYDIRVSREIEQAIETSSENTTWTRTHIIHAIGVFIITGIVLLAIIKNHTLRR